ncbi:MAG: glycosyltransferase family 2 protein [Symploca sp. SIO2E6]|nr:glycosyltransferase family 2 protein [Symploca sp. SIO2E6]
MSNIIEPNNLCPLLVVIVNYRTANLTIDCLRSLVSEVQSLPGMQAVVVDNDSGDGSAEKIGTAIKTEGWSDWASLLPSDYNGGFAFGNNAGIRPALKSSNPPPYFFLLNPDSIARPGALKVLVDFMDEHPQAGIAGSALEKPDGEPWHITFRFPTILSELDGGLNLGIVSKLLSNWVIDRSMPPDKPSETDWIPGASFIIRREVFDSIGLMDEGYFLYYEETDFCLQAKRAGWSCWYVPQSLVQHIGGQSTGYTYDSLEPAKRLPTYRFDSRRRYFVKNHGLLYALLADTVWILGFASWRLRRVIQRKPDTDPPQLLSDFIRNSVFFKGGASS